jgi:hypothetical protein
MPVFTLRPRRRDSAANCRGQATDLLHEVQRCLRRGVVHEMLLTQAAYLWHSAEHLESKLPN